MASVEGGLGRAQRPPGLPGVNGAPPSNGLAASLPTAISRLPIRDACAISPSKADFA